MPSNWGCQGFGPGSVGAAESAREAGAVLGALSGAAVVVWRILGHSAPIAPAVLLIGAAVGLVWGAKAGQVFGSYIDVTFPRKARSHSCGKDF